MNVKEMEMPTQNDTASGHSRAPAVSLRSLLSDTAIYGLANVSDKLLAVVLLPVITAVLSRADYGIISLYTSTSYILFVFCSQGVHHAFYRYYTESQNIGQKRAIVRSAVALSLAYAAVLLPLLFFAGPWLSRWLFDERSYSFIATLGALVVMQTLHAIGVGRLQADGKPWTYFLLSITSSLALRGAGITLVLIGCGVWGWIAGEAVVRLITLVVLAVLALGDLGRTQGQKAPSGMATYGVLLVPSVLSFFVMNVSDKYLLRLLLPDGLEQIGLYSVGERISGVMTLATTAFLIGWQRYAFHNMHRPDASRVLGRSLLLFAVAGSYCAMSLALLGDDLTHWLVHPKFEAGMKVIPPLTLAALFCGLANAAEVGLHKSRRPSRISSWNMAAAVVNVVVAYFAIRRWGISGAAWSTAFSQAFRTALVWRSAQASFHVSLDYRRLATAIGLFSAIYVFGRFFDSFGWMTAGVVQTLLVVMTPGFLWFTPFFPPEQREAILSRLKFASQFLTAKAVAEPSE